jgi:hypothetical protein
MIDAGSLYITSQVEPEDAAAGSRAASTRSTTT